jgi:hypothetical protein
MIAGIRRRQHLEEKSLKAEGYVGQAAIPPQNEIRPPLAAERSAWRARRIKPFPDAFGIRDGYSPSPL